MKALAIGSPGLLHSDGSSDSPNGDEYRDAWEFIWLFMNGGLSVALVLLGGLFAGLTIG